MSKLKLLNYPSGDAEFDKWFKETQPDWAAQIEKHIEADKYTRKLETALRQICKATEADEDNIYLPLSGLEAKRIFEIANKALGQKQ